VDTLGCLRCPKLLSGGRLPGALLVAAAICGTGPSSAAEASFRLDYAAEETCPARSAFGELVEERVRAAGVEAALVTPQAAKVRLVADADGSGFVGQLELVRRDGSYYQRAVNGVSCAEVAHALAFVLALTLTATESPPEEAQEPPPVAEAPKVVLPRVPESPVEEPRSPWSYGVGVQLGARAGLAPQWALVQGAFVEARRAGAGPFSFNLRAAFLRAASVRHTDPSGTTDFSWWAARLEGCPLRFRPLEGLEWLPCAGMHVGRLLATGEPASSVGASKHSSQTWVDGFAASRLELAVARWLSIQAQAELLVPFTRYQFAFDNPETGVYQVPAVAGAAFAGIELRFP